MRIGIVASSGGSVFAQLHTILGSMPNCDYEFLVVTDRPCGAEEFCASHNIRSKRIEEPENSLFCTKAVKFFQECGGVDVCVLFFLRLVTRYLMRYCPVFNIHPSLLPAFKGFGALKAAQDARVGFFGATLHLVDESVDGGPIVAQVVMPMSCDFSLEMVNKFSYVQKVYLLLVLVELMETQTLTTTNKNTTLKYRAPLPFTDRCNPCLSDPLFLERFMEFQREEKVDVIR